MIGLWAWLAGCASAPGLVSWDGREVTDDEVLVLAGTPGEPVPIVVEVTPPNTRVWSVGAPPGWRLDPETLEGTWEPSATATSDFLLLLEHEGAEPVVYEVTLYVEEPG